MHSFMSLSLFSPQIIMVNMILSMYDYKDGCDHFREEPAIDGQFCPQKFKICFFLSRPRTDIDNCGFFLSTDEWHTYAGHNISYLNLFCSGCRCVLKYVKIACLRLKLLTVSNIF